MANISPMINVKHLNFNFLGGFQKNEYYLEYGDFVDIFFAGGGGGGHHKIGVISIHLGSILMEYIWGFLATQVT